MIFKFVGLLTHLAISFSQAQVQFDSRLTVRSWAESCEGRTYDYAGTQFLPIQLRIVDGVAQFDPAQLNQVHCPDNRGVPSITAPFSPGWHSLVSRPDLTVSILFETNADELRIRITCNQTASCGSTNRTWSKTISILGFLNENPAQLTACRDLQGLTVQAGVRCKTRLAGVFERVVEGNFSGWRDRRSGVIWFDDIAELDCNAARAKCLEPQSSLMHRYPRGVPAPEELVVALDNGLTEVYPSLLSQYIWAHANPAYFQYHHRESDMVVYERNRATSDATFSCNTVRTIICSAVTR